jgi:hypothetical protein
VRSRTCWECEGVYDEMALAGWHSGSMAQWRRGTPAGRRKPRHAAVQGRWESLRPAPWSLLRTGAAFVSVVAAFFLVFGLWDERHVLGQPDESGVVVNFHAIGTISQGKTSCDGVEVRLLVSQPRPDLLEPTAELRACEGDYRSGETVGIRRVPGHRDRTYGDPLNGADFVSLGLLVGGAAATAVAAGIYEERRSRTRRK